MDPESMKKLASGFWKHEYRIENNEEVWRCDKRGLEDAIYKIMRDSREAMFFSQDPTRYLDVKFGEGTGYAWGHRNRHDNPYVDMRLSQEMMYNRKTATEVMRERERDATMAYYNTYANTGTTSNTNTTAGSSSAWMESQMQKDYSRMKTGKPPAKPPSVHHNKKLVRNLPFVCGSDDLLNTLQRDFDHWAQVQKRILFA